MTREIREARLGRIQAEVEAEFREATSKFGAFHSTHEGYAVLHEEADELWDAVKANDREGARAEAIQVGAMALRFLYDLD